MGQTDSLALRRDSAETTYPAKYTVLPFVAYSPDTRLMFGGLGVRQFKLQGSGLETRASNVQLTATYTMNKQISIRLQHTVFLPNESWILNGQAIYSKFPKNYWGIGPHTQEEDKVKIDYQKIEMRQRALKKVAEDLYLGPQWHFIYRYDVEFEEARPPIAGTQGNLSNGLGIVFNWDKRDNVLTPTRNHYLELSTPLLRHFPAKRIWLPALPDRCPKIPEATAERPTSAGLPIARIVQCRQRTLRRNGNDWRRIHHAGLL